MNNLNSAIFITLSILLALTTRTDGVTYSAGVVEFAAQTLKPSETPHQLIQRNMQQYLKIISTAAEHGVDILVFPECGLTSINIPAERNLIFPYLTEIPEVGSNPCELPDVPEVLKILSCASKNNSIYVIFNLDELARCTIGQEGCPSDGHLFYNTNLAIDRTGTIVSRYRKYNLFVEREFNATKTPEHSWFETDFGVRFGMFICFDILFQEPTFGLLSKLNISNFVYSAAWFSELPFLTATPVQAAWAYNNDVNLLAAGYSNTINKNAGSGIYAGRDGTLIATMPHQSSTKLLIAQVSSDHRRVTPSPTEEITFFKDHINKFDFFHDNITNYTTIIISNKSASLQYEHDGFSCQVAAKLSFLGDGSVYRLLAYSGKRTYGLDKTIRLEVCGVVACQNTKISSCGYKPSFTSSTSFESISISASSKKAMLSYPITMTNEFLPITSNSFQFDRDDSEGKIKMHMYTKTVQTDLIAFSLFRNN